MKAVHQGVHSHPTPQRSGNMGEQEKQELEEMVLILRPDLVRAFRRCVWMEVHETGRSPFEVQNRLIEELLRLKGC